jgi:hypothetical protein
MDGTTDLQVSPRGHEEGNSHAIPFVLFGKGSNPAKVPGYGFPFGSLTERINAVGHFLSLPVFFCIASYPAR